jgi:hypothetical protein
VYGGLPDAAAKAEAAAKAKADAEAAAKRAAAAAEAEAARLREKEEEERRAAQKAEEERAAAAAAATARAAEEAERLRQREEEARRAADADAAAKAAADRARAEEAAAKAAADAEAARIEAAEREAARRAAAEREAAESREAAALLAAEQEAAAARAATLPTDERICATCDKSIATEMVVAGGRYYHADDTCFSCCSCATGLGDTYFEQGDALYCEPCIRALEDETAREAAPTCKICGEAILEQHAVLNDDHFHNACLKCNKCQIELMKASSVKLLKGSFMCGDCALATLQSCSGCGQPCTGAYLAVFEKHYHKECLKCVSCQVALDPSKIYEKAGNPVCEQHA